MKKTICVALSLCLAFSGAYGCSKKDSKSSASVSSDQELEAAANQLSYNPDDYVTLGDYKNLEGYEVSCTVTDEELEEEIDSQLYYSAEYTDITDRGAKEEDYITIDFTASVDGTEVEDCKETDYEFQLGNGDFNDTIEEKLMGTKVGDSITVDMEIPEDLSATNAGDMGTFEVKVTKLQLENVPEYNLDFVKANSEFETIEEYEANLKEDLLAYKEQDYFSETAYELLDKVIANSTFKEDYPQELYDTCKEEFYSDNEATAEMLGMEVDEYLKDFCGYEDQDIENEILSIIKQHLTVYSIALKEDLMITDEEYTEYVDSVVAEFGYSDAAELEAEYSEAAIRYSAVFDNVTSLLYENANLTEISEEEYNELSASEEAEEADMADEEEISLDEDAEEIELEEAE